MSSKHRRAKRKIQTLVRMDATRERMYGQKHRQYCFVMFALSKALQKKGLKQRIINALIAANSKIRGLK